MFPSSVIPYFVGRQASIQAIEAANDSLSRQILLVAQKDSSQEAPGAGDLYPVGVVCKILQLLRLPDGTIKILCEGLYRARWQMLETDKPYMTAAMEKMADLSGNESEKPALVRAVHEFLDEFGRDSLKLSRRRSSP